MRWTLLPSAIEESRVVTRFALLPVCIDQEVRWLEFVKILQHWVVAEDGAGLKDGWVNVEFVED